MIKQAGFPEGHNELKLFKLAEPDWELYDSLPAFKQEKIALSPEYQTARRRGSESSQENPFDDMEDDTPF